MIKSYRDLIVWQKAMDFVEAVYLVTKSFPREELYGITSQLRRSAVSLPSNIAEGQGRASTKEFLHHLSIAYGSLCESETQLLLAQRLNYISQEKNSELLTQAAEIGRMINGLYSKLSPQS